MSRVIVDRARFERMRQALIELRDSEVGWNLIGDYSMRYLAEHRDRLTA